MNKNVLNILLIIVTLFSGVTAFISFRSNQQYKNEIVTRNQNTNEIAKRDSIYTEKNKHYSKVIEKYTRDTVFTIGKSKITIPQIIKLYNKTHIKNSDLIDSLSIQKTQYSNLQILDLLSLNQTLSESVKTNKELLKRNLEYIKTYNEYKETLDSLLKYKLLFISARKIYGFKLDITTDSNYVNRRVFYNKYTKIDTALYLYNLYRKKIKKIDQGLYNVDFKGNVKIDFTNKK